MSRSYKHTPMAKSNSRTGKQATNKTTRRILKDIDYEVGNFSHYKSIANSWNICDYKCYMPSCAAAYRK